MLIHTRTISLFYYTAAKALKCGSKPKGKRRAEAGTGSRFSFCPKSCGFGVRPVSHLCCSEGGSQKVPARGAEVPSSEGLPCTTQEQSKEANTQQVKYHFFKKFCFTSKCLYRGWWNTSRQNKQNTRPKGLSEICSQNSTEGQELEIFTALNYRSVPLPPSPCV